MDTLIATYPFCFNISDGKSVAVASPNSKQTLGTDVRTIKDATGKLIGPDLYDVREVPSINLESPRPTRAGFLTFNAIQAEIAGQMT